MQIDSNFLQNPTPRSDAQSLFIPMLQKDPTHAARRLSRRQSHQQQPAAQSFRWRRPSFSSKQKEDSDSNNININTNFDDRPNINDDKDKDREKEPLREQPKKPPPVLSPAPDSRAEIKKLLRGRDDDAASDKDSECSRPMQALEEKTARQMLHASSAIDLSSAASSSLVPETLPVQPTQDIPNAAQFRAKYNLYNPVGPRFYQNVHLIPSHHRSPPSDSFSTSFPPIRTAIGARAGHTADSGLTRTPSGSPIPTPNGSQTRLGTDGQRTRKVSQTAHDNVDMLDRSSPYPTNWHHDSPYDVIGLSGPPPPQDMVRLIDKFLRISTWKFTVYFFCWDLAQCI